MDSIKVLLEVLNLLVASTAVLERLTALRTQVEAMVAEGREPTTEEWNALFAVLQSDADALNALANPPLPPITEPGA